MTPIFVYGDLRATSRTRLGTRDHYTPSTVIGGKRGASPSSLHIALEGPTEHVNARWMWSAHGFLHDIKRSMFLGHLDYFQKPPLECRPNTKPVDHDTLNTLFYHVSGPTWIEIGETSVGRGPGHIWLHTTLEGRWPHYMILEVPWDGLWTLSFGLSRISWSRLLARVWSAP